MTRDELVAQIKDDIAATEKSVFFWNAQPDAATVFGFDIVGYRKGLTRQLEEQQAALKVAEAS